MLEKIINFAKTVFYVDNKSLKYGYGMYLVMFLLYIEFSSGMGGVWLRKDSLNNTVFSPKGIIGFFKKPFTNSFFWYPRYWDLNYYVGGYICANIINKFDFIK
tara:strand:+ start:550 stop:858 length:309 start_codon:yes stop_codon:yes gene_type:complete